MFSKKRNQGKKIELKLVKNPRCSPRSAARLEFSIVFGPSWNIQRVIHWANVSFDSYAHHKFKFDHYSSVPYRRIWNLFFSLIQHRLAECQINESRENHLSIPCHSSKCRILLNPFRKGVCLKSHFSPLNNEPPWRVELICPASSSDCLVISIEIVSLNSFVWNETTQIV